MQSREVFVAFRAAKAETPLLLPDEMSKGAAEAGWPTEDIADKVCGYLPRS